MGANNDLLHVRDRLYESNPPYNKLDPSLLEDLGSHIDIGTTDRVEDIGETDLVSDELVGVHVDLVLLDVSPHTGHL